MGARQNNCRRTELLDRTHKVLAAGASIKDIAMISVSLQPIIIPQSMKEYMKEVEVDEKLVKTEEPGLIDYRNDKIIHRQLNRRNSFKG